jgi:putative transposase
MCRVLEVSASGYYGWRQRPISKRKQENTDLVNHITQVHQQSRQTYGSPRIHAELKAQGIQCGESRVARLMKHNGIQAKRKKKYVITTDSSHDLPIAGNRLNQQFTAHAPNEKWVADITYIWTQEGWLYLAVVLDLFSRRVVG